MNWRTISNDILDYKFKSERLSFSKKSINLQDLTKAHSYDLNSLFNQAKVKELLKFI